MSTFTRYEIQSGDLTEGQLDIICNFNVKSGARAVNKESYKSVSVGFNKGKCFHVAFKN